MSSQTPFKVFCILSGLSLSSLAFSGYYDGIIKDNKGRVTGYLKEDDGKTYILDTRGRRGNYIEQDGTIKDHRGNTKGKIEKHYFSGELPH